MHSIMTETGIIYLIRNTATGKIYIGQTRDTLKRRWNGHRSDARSERRHQSRLHGAIHRYGQDAFSIEVLETLPVADLNNAEERWIAHFDSTNKSVGYNIRPGGGSSPLADTTKAKLRAVKLGKPSGSKGAVRSADTRAAISAAKKGKPWSATRRERHDENMRLREAAKPPKVKKARGGWAWSEETRAKMEAWWERRANLGLKAPPRSDEFRRKQSEAHKGKKVSDDTKTLMKSGQQARREREQREFDAMTPEQQAQVSAARRGRKTSEETKQKLREAAIRREARKKAAKGETE